MITKNQAQKKIARPSRLEFCLMAAGELTGAGRFSVFSESLASDLASSKLSLNFPTLVKDMGAGACAISFGKTHFKLALERTSEGPRVTSLIQVRSL